MVCVWATLAVLRNHSWQGLRDPYGVKVPEIESQSKLVFNVTRHRNWIDEREDQILLSLRAPFPKLGLEEESLKAEQYGTGTLGEHAQDI